MRALQHGIRSAVTSPSTSAAVLVFGVVGLSKLSPTLDPATSNTWDLLFPMLTDSLVLGLGGLAWWFVLLVHRCAAASQPERLIRYGTPRRATWTELQQASGSLLAWGAQLAALYAIGLAPRGFALNWSTAALHPGPGSQSAFAAASLARHFANPLTALAACIAFSTIATLAFAALALAVAARGHPRAAVTGMSLVAVWAFLCSFSLVSIPPALDASVWFSLPWALTTPSGPGAAAVVWLAVVVAAAVTASGAEPRRVGLLLISSRAGVIVLAAGLSLLADADAVGEGAHGAFVVSSVFAGAHGALVPYLIVALIPITVATRTVVELQDRSSGRHLLEAIRLGSFIRWTSRLLRTGTIDACAATAAAAALVTGVAALTTVAPFEASRSVLVELLFASAGLLVSTLLLTVTATALYWTGSNLDHGWPFAAGIGLLLGYPLLIDLGPVNVFAPYSLDQGRATEVTPLLCTAGATLAVVLITAALIRRTTTISATS